MSMSPEIDEWMDKHEIVTVNAPSRLSRKQSLVYDYLTKHETINIEQAVHLIGKDIYCNESKHVGAILSNMVKRGIIKRESKGIYTAL